MEKTKIKLEIDFTENLDRDAWIKYMEDDFIDNHLLYALNSVTMKDSLSKDGTKILLDFTIKYDYKFK
jgi:hypothetical protein